MNENINFNESVNIALQHHNDSLKKEIIEKNQLIEMMENELNLIKSKYNNIREELNKEKELTLKIQEELQDIKNKENNGYMDYVFSFFHKK